MNLNDDHKLELPTTAHHLESEKKNPSRLRLVHLIAAMFVTYATFATLRGGAKVTGNYWLGCGHRNASKLASTLPAYRTLPSGDKIPSVALGVWQAGKGEVGDAVKVRLSTSLKAAKYLSSVQRLL